MTRSQSLALFAAVGGTLSIGACVSSNSPQQQEPFKPNTAVKTARNVNVTELYNSNCSNCHGRRAEGGGAATQSMLTKEKFDQSTDRRFFDAIRDGIPGTGMAAMGETMSDEMIWALVVHIRELQRDALRAEFGGPKADGQGVFNGKDHDYKVSTVLDKAIKTPWSIDWLKDGTMLVSSRPGGIKLVKGGAVVGEVTGLPECVELGQGGQMDVRVHPTNGFVYISYTEMKGGGAFTKVVRGKITVNGSNATWGSEKTIYEVPESNYNLSQVHFGGKIAFDTKGHVFVSQGERGSGNLAQRLDLPNGKIHRFNDDGSIPKDNPFIGKGMDSVWSYGHRNPQGLAIDASGNVFDTEHGPRGGDELNSVQRGGNYGWPNVAFSINYNDAPLSIPWSKPGESYKMPVLRWLPSIAASGLDVMQGSAFPKWKGDLIAGGLAGQTVRRVRVKAGALVEEEELLYGIGRVREVKVGPDGLIYVAVNQPDRIIRIEPAK